jgi:DNA-binding SARP family transcriptional activator
MLSIQRRIPRALLMYLGFHEHMVLRSELIQLLWSSVEEKVGRRRLRDILTRLRSALPDPALLVTENDRVGLDRDRVFVDTIEFTRLTQQIGLVHRESRQKTLSGEKIRRVIRAIEIWRSPKFMAGFIPPSSNEFDRWFSEIANTIEHTRLTLIEKIMDIYAADDDLDQAIRWARTALEMDAINPGVHFHLLTWLDEEGRNKEALDHCKYLYQLYRQEDLGYLPDQLESLSRKIREKTSLLKIDDQPSWTPFSHINVNFIGRKKELEELKKVYQYGGIVIVSGVSGSGKTRLVYEFYQRQEPLPSLMTAPARPMEDNLPYQPLIEMLRNFAEDDVKGVEPVWRIPLVNLLPEFFDPLPGYYSAYGFTKGEMGGLIFEAIHQVLLLKARQGRLFMFLDDAQWSDEATQEALVYLIEQHFFDKNGILVLAVRQETHDSDLGTFIDQIKTLSVRSASISLSNLSQVEVGDLISSVLGENYSEETITRLMREVGSNPLYLLETLRSYLEYTPRMDLDGFLDHVALPSNIHLLLRRRLDSISFQSQRALFAAVVLEDEFSQELIEDVTGLDSEEVARAIEELEWTHFIAPQHPKDTNPRYVVVHERFRNALHLEVSHARRRMLHRRIAKALVSFNTDGKQQAAKIAKHYEAAGELRSAYHNWIKAGRYAQGLYSKTQAFNAYQQAERLLTPLGDSISDEDIYLLYIIWGEFADDFEDNSMLHHIYSALDAIGRRRHSSLLVGSACSGKSQVYLREGRYDESLSAIEEAQSHLSRLDNVLERVKGNNRHALVLAYLASYEESDLALEKSHELAADLQDPFVWDDLTNTQIQLSMIYSERGWPEIAADIVTRHLHVNQDSQDPLNISIFQGTMAIAQLYMSRYSEVVELSQKPLQMFKDLRNWRLMIVLQLLVARAELAMGHMDRCWQNLQDVLDKCAKYGHRNYYGEALSCLGGMYWNLRVFSSSIELYERGLGFKMDLFHRLDLLMRKGQALISSDQIEAGMELITDVIANARQAGYARIYLRAETHLASAYLQSGQAERADGILQEVSRETERRSLVSIKAGATMGSARCALQRGDYAEAILLCEEVITWARQAKNFFIEIFALRIYLRAQEGVGILTTDTVVRFEEMVDYLDQHMQSEELRPYFMQFKREVIPLAT